jgi:NAD(P)-dependent dehydrogenase (short-subunit alcohol dehydrogenase family)
VVITGRNEETLEEAAVEIGHGAKAFLSDVSKIADLATLYKNIEQAVGKIDLLVLNAGTSYNVPIENFTEEMFDNISNTNYKGVFFSIQKAMPFLNDGGSVIITASTMADKGAPNSIAYSSSKAAARGMARGFAAALAPRNIRVNALSPGLVVTPLYQRTGTPQEQIDKRIDSLVAITPLKRVGTLEEIAKGFLFLASEDSTFMTGAELLLDGGFRSI